LFKTFKTNQLMLLPFSRNIFIMERIYPLGHFQIS
jgi:hypothetical protein